jgi:hypothetical protein
MFSRLILWVSCSVVCCCVLIGRCFESVCDHAYVSFVLRAQCLIVVCIVSRLSISCNCVIILVYLSAPLIACAALFCKTWSFCITGCDETKEDS